MEQIFSAENTFDRATTWFISDLHIGHGNVLRFEEGLHNFTDIKEHDHAIAKNWHDTVGPDDHVFFLGDLAMERTKWKHIRENLGKFGKLPGKVHWIIGNHDLHIDQAWLYNLREIMDIVEFTNYKEIMVKDDSEWGLKRFVLFHYPLYEWNGKYRGAYHLYGHSHAHVHPLAGTMSACACITGYKPVNADWMIDKIEELKCKLETQSSE